MLNVIDKICKNKDLVSLYANSEDSSKFCYGRFLNFDNENFLFLMITPDGKYDGLLVKSINDIIRINKNDCYDERMQKLLCLEDMEDLFLKLDKSNDVLKFSLLMSQINKKIVSIELNHSGTDDVVGFVNMMSDTICEIKQIDFYGRSDGVAYVKIDEISQVSLDSSAEQILLKLFEKNESGTATDDPDQGTILNY